MSAKAVQIVSINKTKLTDVPVHACLFYTSQVQGICGPHHIWPINCEFGPRPTPTLPNPHLVMQTATNARVHTVRSIGKGPFGPWDAVNRSERSVCDRRIESSLKGLVAGGKCNGQSLLLFYFNGEINKRLVQLSEDQVYGSTFFFNSSTRHAVSGSQSEYCTMKIHVISWTLGHSFHFLAVRVSVDWIWFTGK